MKRAGHHVPSFVVQAELDCQSWRVWGHRVQMAAILGLIQILEWAIKLSMNLQIIQADLFTHSLMSSQEANRVFNVDR